MPTDSGCFPSPFNLFVLKSKELSSSLVIHLWQFVLEDVSNQVSGFLVELLLRSLDLLDINDLVSSDDQKHPLL